MFIMLENKYSAALIILSNNKNQSIFVFFYITVTPART